MENYIVRIYRRDQDNPDHVTGMLESVEAETRHPFKTLKGLHSLLSDTDTPAESKKLKTVSAGVD